MYHSLRKHDNQPPPGSHQIWVDSHHHSPSSVYNTLDAHIEKWKNTTIESERIFQGRPSSTISYLLHMTRRPVFWMTSTSSLAGVTVRVDPRQIMRSHRWACSKARFRISSSKLSPKLIMVSFRKPLQPYMTLFEDCIVQTIANNVSYINQTKNLNTSSSENQKNY